MLMVANNVGSSPLQQAENKRDNAEGSLLINADICGVNKYGAAQDKIVGGQRRGATPIRGWRRSGQKIPTTRPTRINAAPS